MNYQIFRSIVAILFIFTIAISANAQSVSGLSADTLRPAPGGGGVFGLDFPTVKRHLKWTAGGLFHYGEKPVKRTVIPVGEPGFEDYPMQRRVQGDFSFAIGFNGDYEFGLNIPVVLYQAADAAGMDLQTAGILDPRLSGKMTIIRHEAWTLGAGLTISVPVGHYASSGSDFMGYRGPAMMPEALGSVKLGRVLLAANLGLLLRPNVDVPVYNQRMATTFSVGAAVDVRDFEEAGGVRIGLETNGEVALGISSLAQFPWEVIGGVKTRTRRDLVFSAGAGVGMTDALGTPLFRVLLGIYFDTVLHNCEAGPEDYDGFQDDDKCVDPDNDQDGIPDELDQCRDEGEDLDGFQDEDGCPEYDNDGDGIPDVMDKCPLIPEDLDNYEDEDGCSEEGPGKATVKVTESQLLISSKIYFDYNKSEIKVISYPILDKIAETLNNNPDITSIMVEGHSDNEGTEEYNIKLSTARAKAVVDYLIGKSVAKERLSYKGFGFSMPKASNTSEEGRAINRRVEFKIQKGQVPNE